MKVASTKYEVAMSIFTIFMPENVHMYQIVFTTTIDTMLFSVSFTEILTSYGPFVRSWTPETGTPTDPTGSPEHRKNHLDEVQAGSGAVTHRGDICVFKCFAILYCMADDVLKWTMYWKTYKKLHDSLKWVREGCMIPVPVIVLYLYCTLYQ